MRKKDIKAHIRKQLKQNHSGWNKLNKKKKKEIVRNVMMEVKSQYEAGELLPISIEEQLNIQTIPENVMTIEQMESFIAKKQNQNSNLLEIDRVGRNYLGSEMRKINELINDTVLNGILACSGYTPSKRIKTPAMFFRAELLKALDYAEMSYRKFCRLEVNDMERKKNRYFIGLSLRQKQVISHTELSMFRSSLSYEQQLNLMVYFLAQFKLAGFFNGKVFHGIDGTDLASKVTSYPIDSIEVTISGKKEKLSIYNQVDIDCGERRNKSDKSKFFVGYKIHTLTVLNADTGMAYPLISLVAAANHHDNNFLSPLVKLGKALGLDIQLVITDQGYDGTNVEFMDENNVTIVSQSQTKMSSPDHVESSGETSRVYMSGNCEVPMEYVGREGSNHEFHCGAPLFSCPFSAGCPKSRIIPVDNGLFGAIPKVFGAVSHLETTRKIIERPFNLLKHRNGVDRINIKSQRSVQTVITIGTIAILLIEIAGFRKEIKPDYHQVKFSFAA